MYTGRGEGCIGIGRALDLKQVMNAFCSDLLFCTASVVVVNVDVVEIMLSGIRVSVNRGLGSFFSILHGWLSPHTEFKALSCAVEGTNAENKRERKLLVLFYRITVSYQGGLTRSIAYSLTSTLSRIEKCMDGWMDERMDNRW